MRTSEYLYKLQPVRTELLANGSTPAEDEIINAHFEYLKNLSAQKIVLLAGRTLNTDPSGFGIVIFKAPSEREARWIMESDPAVKSGVMKAELYPYHTALWGF
ncbi:MAG: hypothetical protein JXB60_01035 [Candidatus Cloacimonetes bacterium]|nr:hypothetical protein [Candidatus Cloacimonadota bacterium]